MSLHIENLHGKLQSGQTLIPSGTTVSVPQSAYFKTLPLATTKTWPQDSSPEDQQGR
jgi:hypothetical protein